MMKKIIFGLFLTVGISGFSMANTIESENLYTSNTQTEISLDESELLFSCTTKYVQRWYDCDGSFTDTTTAISEGGCGGSANGSLILNILRVDGCPEG